MITVYIIYIYIYIYRERERERQRETERDKQIDIDRQIHRYCFSHFIFYFRLRNHFRNLKKRFLIALQRISEIKKTLIPLCPIWVHLIWKQLIPQKTAKIILNSCMMFLEWTVNMKCRNGKIFYFNDEIKSNLHLFLGLDYFY